MTISSLTNRNDYTGNGSLNTYSYTFKIFNEEHLLVTVADLNGVETTLALATDYTVTGVGETAGGTIVLVNSGQAWLTGGNLTTGYALTIRRVLPLLQETDIRNQGDFFPEVHENQFDRDIMIAQQLQAQLDSQISLPETETPTDASTTFPSIAARTNRFMRWDGSGDITVSTINFDDLAAGFLFVGNVSGEPQQRAITGDVLINSSGVTSISDLEFTKLEALNSGNILVGNASNQATQVAMTGDVTISNAGVTAIGTGVIVNADVNATAQIDFSKLALLTSGNILVGNASNIASSVAMSGDVLINNSGVTAINANVIVNGDINASAAIALTKLATLNSLNLPKTDASGFIISSPWAFDASGHITTGQQDQLRFADGGGTNYVAFFAPNSVSSSYTLQLPAAQGAADTYLVNDGTGVLTWTTIAGGGGGTVSAGVAGRMVWYAASGNTVNDTSALTTDGSTWVAIVPGSAAAPGLAVQGDLDTGLAQVGIADSLGIATGGGFRFTVENSVSSFLNRAGFVSGTLGTPGWYFTSDTDTGAYNPSADNLTLVAGGNAKIAISDLDGALTFGVSTIAGFFDMRGDQSGAVTALRLLNNSNTAGSDARLSIATGGSSSGDAYINIDVQDTTGWGIGVDNSIGQLFSIYTFTAGTGTPPGSGTNRLTLTTAGQMAIGAGSASVPAYSFLTDTDCGTYLRGTNQVAGALGGELSWLHDRTAHNFYASNAGTPVLRMQIDQAGINMLNSARILSLDGSLSAPSYGFTSDPNSGLYLFAADNLGLAAGGALTIRVTSTRMLIATGDATGPGLSFINATGTGVYCNNSNGDLQFAEDGSRVFFMNQTGIGSDANGSETTPAYRFVNGSGYGMWYNGGNDLNFSANGVRKLSVQTGRIEISNSTFPAGTTGTLNFGDATNYWNDISYKTLTDRGCLGWFDDGVEMSDGKVYDDLTALSMIKKHPTKKTIYGAPMLDYKSFPKVSYKRAFSEGIELKRDSNDEPIGGADGIEMTSMFSIMIGAFKMTKVSLDDHEDRIKKLEQKVGI